MIIRILLIVGLAATAWLVFLRRKRLPVHIVMVTGLLVTASAAVVFPDLTQAVAEFVGVGRGSDLVTYLSIVAVMFVLVHYYTKFVEQQEKITQLTRELAILRGELELAGRLPVPAPDASDAQHAPEAQDATDAKDAQDAKGARDAAKPAAASSS